MAGEICLSQRFKWWIVYLPGHDKYARFTLATKSPGKLFPCYARVIVSEQKHYRRLNVEQMLSIKYNMIKAKALKTDTPANDDK